MRKEYMPIITMEDGTPIDIPTFTIRGDRVMIFPHEAEKISTGGIIIPATAAEEPLKGTLVMVGPGDEDDKGISNTADLKVGMNVWYGKYAGTDFEWKGQKFKIMRELDILGYE